MFKLALAAAAAVAAPCLRTLSVDPGEHGREHKETPHRSGCQVLRYCSFTNLVPATVPRVESKNRPWTDQELFTAGSEKSETSRNFWLEI